MVLKKPFRALGAIKSIEKRGVIVHGTYYNATIAAYVTLYLRLGKDEVGSSNLPSSSKKASKTSAFDAFCCKNAEKCVGQNVGQLPDPHAKM